MTLVHLPRVAVDRLHRVCYKHRVEELSRRLRVQVSQEFHGTLEVGEEDGDLLALASEAGLRGVGLWRAVFRIYRPLPESHPALAAEFLAWRISTHRTDKPKRVGLHTPRRASGLWGSRAGTEGTA